MADAVSMASILHCNLVKHNDFMSDFSGEGNVEYLKNKNELLLEKDLNKSCL